MQEFLEHAAPDGTLGTLGEIGAEEEFYEVNKRPKQKNGIACSAMASEDELQRVQVHPVLYGCCTSWLILSRLMCC